MSGAGAAAAGADIEAGADTVETGGEEADGTGQGGEAIQGKDSERCDPSRSGGKERKGKRRQLRPNHYLMSHGRCYSSLKTTSSSGGGGCDGKGHLSQTLRAVGTGPLHMGAVWRLPGLTESHDAGSSG